MTATGRQTEPSAASDLEILEARAQLLAQPLVEPSKLPLTTTSVA